MSIQVASIITDGETATHVADSPPSVAAPAPEDARAILRAIATKLGFDAEMIELSEATHRVELNGRTYAYAGGFDGAGITVYRNHVIAEMLPGILAHAITHEKLKALDRLRALAELGGLGEAKSAEGVTTFSREHARAHRANRIGQTAASAVMLAEMARVKVETSRLPGSGDWREMFRRMDVAYEKTKAPAA